VSTPVNFPIRLQDQVSGPAKTVVSSLGKVAKAADGVNKAAGGGKGRGGKSDIDRALEKQSRAFEKQRKLAQKAAQAHERANKKAGDNAKGILGSIGGKVLGVAAALGVAKLASSAFDFGESMVEGVIAAARFKEDTQLALQTLLKSGEAARGAIGSMRKIAGDLALDPREALGGLVELAGKGFGVDQIERMTRAMADLKVVSPKSDPSRIIAGISKIKATGYLQGDELNILVEAGVDASRIYDNLAKIMGKTVAQVQKLKTAGKVSATDAIEAVMRAVNQTTGGRAVGEVAAQRARTTISGTIDMIKSRWESFLLDLDIGAGDDTIFGFLRRLADLLDTTTGQGARLKAAVGGAFDAVGEALGDIFGKGGEAGIETLVSGIETAAEVLKIALPGIVAFFDAVFGRVLGIDTGVRGVAGSLKDWAKETLGNKDGMAALGREVGTNVLGSLKSIGIAAQNFSNAMRAIGPVLEIAMRMQEGFERAGLAVMGLINRIMGFVEAARSGGAGIGDAIVDGIAGAIAGGAGRVVDAVKGAAGGAVDTAKSVLGIKSPSKVFEQIGVHTVEGFAKGIAANDNGGSLLRGALEPPTGAAARGVGLSLAGSAPGGGGVVVNITVNGGDDPEAIARAVRREVVAFFEQQATAGGLKATGT
jgi:tape measure domain-containing protein